ncbi:MAG: sensor histidine kinase [Oscillospiraceae bacterium]
MKRRFFIRNFILVALPVLLAVLLLGSMAAYVTMKSAQKAITTANEQAVSRIRESTELIFSEADAQSLNYSFSPTVILRLEDLLSNGYSGKEQIDTSSIIKTFLDSNVNSKMYLHSVYIYLANEKQNFFASSVGVANSQNFGDLAWIDRLDSVPNTEKQWLEPRTINAYSISSYSTDVLSLFKRLYTSDRQKPTGALVMNIRKDYLTSFYSAYLPYPGQSILLLNAEGVLLCGTGNLKDTTALPNLQSLEKNYYIAKQSNEAYGVVYVSLIPRSAVSLQAHEMVPVVVGAVFLALVTGSLLAYLTSRRNARDVGNILQLVDSAEHGRELPNLPASSDAYGYIMQGIVKAFVEKSLLDKQLIEKKYTLEAMHFSFLQSQLNPHFLFNTLKNIFWKTVKLTGEPNDASHMIDLLTSVLYYAL